MFCSKCGTENPEGAKFCSKCGAGLGAPAKPSAQLKVQLNQKRRVAQVCQPM